MPKSLSLEEKRDCILASERRLASGVAGDVIDRPVLALWMIFIPVFFVIYFFQLKRYRNGLKDFNSNFLITRKRALDAVYQALADNTALDMDRLVDVSDSPEQARKEYQDWVAALAEYYRTLLTARGGSFSGLVRFSHRNKANHLLYINRLGQAERAYNRVLIEHLPGDRESAISIVAAMEESTQRIRRELASELFP